MRELLLILADSSYGVNMIDDSPTISAS